MGRTLFHDRHIHPLVVALSILLGACHRPSGPPAAAGSSLDYVLASDPDRYGPGFDVLAFRSSGEPRHLEFSESSTLWLDSQGRALMGPDAQHLKATGLSIPRSVVGFDPGAVFWMAPDQTLSRADLGGPSTRLWRAHWEVDELREDRLAEVRQRSRDLVCGRGPIHESRSVS